MRMLGELRGVPLLRGARGTRPADLAALSRVITAIADAAASLDGSLRALEVNPLWVDGSQIEALDALVVTGSDGHTAGGPDGAGRQGTAEPSAARPGPAGTGGAAQVSDR